MLFAVLLLCFIYPLRVSSLGLTASLWLCWLCVNVLPGQQAVVFLTWYVVLLAMRTP